MEKEKIAIRESYGKYLEELGHVNPKIVVLDADLSNATKTNIFEKSFPNRFFNVGICEQNLVGIGCGFAEQGFVPFVNTFSIFALGRAYDQVRNSVCYPNQNVKIVGTHYGVTVGQDGATHQMLEDIAIANTIPNMEILSPSDDISTKVLLKQMSETKGPCYMRVSRYAVPKLYDEKDVEQIERGYIEKGENVDGVIFTTGDVSWIAYEAKEVLKLKYNKLVKVVDVFKIKHIDEDCLLKNARNAKTIVSIENHNLKTGLGSIISNVLNENNVFKKVIKLGINDSFGQSGTPEELLDFYGLSVESIVKQFVKK